MENQQKTFSLSIADFAIQLHSDSLIELEDGYLPFLKNTDNQPDINIECFAGWSEISLDASQKVFEAKNEVQKFYSIYSRNSDLVFVIYNQQTNEIQQIAILNENFTHWKVYSEAINDVIMPLKYPMGPIIMHYMTLTSDAVMMHASCAFDGEKGRMFSGFSGAGKSTMSMIWSAAGNQIINDDRLIIRKTDTGFNVHNTPMYYKDMPKVAPLSAVYLISHSPENKIKKLSGAMAVTRVMAFCIQNNFEQQFIQKRLNIFTELSLQVPVYDLGFVPNESVVHFIKAHEA